MDCSSISEGKIDRHYIERLLRAEDSLLRAWLQFKEVALERIELKEVEKECECSNPACTVKDPRKHFRECAGCEGVLYCSRGCQSRDWKEGNHRSACKLIDRDTARDTKFIYAVMERGLPRVADKLRAQKRASFPDAPWSSLWIDCNCMGSEPEYRVQRHLTPAAVALPRAEEICHDIKGEPVKVAISRWNGTGMFRLMTMVGLASIEAVLPLNPGDEFVHRIDTHRN
ncbi:hypothetical protein JAAARDRAFT_408444 [Jaapia argillacea MUCL 33604]|uniref:MYND-type domain-containing protein n=1 Tax=Jaapia argillacea MUCL 33604 TaxID=933084 RepID=A0A067PGI7_9AGAM|nr:hypothetical protein JAAARDRAFT_408444 [Jaapia argillacea MUCL 33604]